MPCETKSTLFRHTRETYGGSFDTDLLEQYKLYVQSADNVSARRIASSRYLLTLNTALVALYGFQVASFGQNHWTLLLPVLCIPVVGTGVSILWYQILESHRNLNDVKFKLIHEFEQHLPAAMYKYEWELAEEGRGKAYRATTKLERWLPVLFIVLHIILIIVVLAILSPLGCTG